MILFAKSSSGLGCILATLLIFAAQEQGLFTNALRAHIYSLPCALKCRLCGSSDETVDYLVICCPLLAQSAYKQGHDKVTGLLYWQLSRMAGIMVCNDWWCHSPDRVSENEHFRLLWDFTPITNHHLPHNRPDIIFIMKDLKEMYLINVAIPGDSMRLSHKFAEKQNKYVDLKIELSQLWHCRVCIIPIIVGALGSVPMNWRSSKSVIPTFQRSVVYGTAATLRWHMNI